MERKATIGVLLVLAAVTATAPAATYRVGAKREHKTLGSVLARLKPGDTVEIDPGVYREVHQLHLAGTKTAPITIRGVGKNRPVFDAKGLNVSGRGPVPRGIFEIRGPYVVIEHLEFKNARNGNNGAGIRLLGSTNAVIRDCFIHHCDMGLMGGDRETALIERSEVAFNGTKQFDGYSHNFYMHGNRVVVRGCYIHDSVTGQNYKTRAHYNELWYNWIADSNEGEVGPVDGKGQTDRPNSNVLMVGNVVVSRADRTGNKSKFVLFGSELGGSHDGTLYLYHNTFVAGSPEVIFVQLADPKARAVMRNNIFVGSDRIFREAKPAVSVTGSHNWVPKTAAVPKGMTDTIRGTDPGFVDAARCDFHLKAGSPCINAGATNLTYVDGDGVKHTVTPTQAYVRHLRLDPRKAVGAPDLGAYEYAN